jgi:protein-S-isoprenylcysteine O-methyltransferase Ste14
MGGVALGAYLAFLVVAFGARAVLHRRRTGSAGFAGISGQVGSAEWWAGALFVVAVVVGLIAPAGQLAGVVGPLAVLDGWVVRILGAVLASVGIVATVLAQQAMGRSWRVGVDHDEITGLVTTGPFALVRNPVFAAMIIAAIGLMLLAPNVLAIVGVLTLVVAVQLQVRIVEESYLRRVHGDAYVTYAGQVGRLFPGLGRLSGTRPTTAS